MILETIGKASIKVAEVTVKGVEKAGEVSTHAIEQAADAVESSVNEIHAERSILLKPDMGIIKETSLKSIVATNIDWEWKRVVLSETTESTVQTKEEFPLLKALVLAEEQTALSTKEVINPILDKQKDVCDKIEKDGNIDTMSTTEKGNYGEMKTDIEMEEQGWKRISTDTVTSIDDKGHQGIDGVYERVNPETGEKEYCVVESKYGTSELNEHTSDGKQMGENWIDKRLDDAVGKEKADEIRESKILNPDSVSSYISRIDKDGYVELTKLDSNANEIGGTNNER